MAEGQTNESENIDYVNKIILGDSLEILKTIPSHIFDISFTSPPYNSIRHKKYDEFSDNNKDYLSFLCDFTDELIRVTKKYVIINIQCNYYNRQDVLEYIGKYNNKIKRIVIWNKQNPTPSSANRLTNAHEFFLILSDEEVMINSISMKDVITFPINTNKVYGHKAIMNKDIAKLFIKEFTQENDIVMDCFMGVGTTAVVCRELGRNYVGIEINPKYIEVANLRLKETEEMLKYNQTSLF